MLSDKKEKWGVCVFLSCALILTLCFAESAWAQLPKPKTLQAKPKLPDTPKVPANVLKPEDVAPAKKKPFYSGLFDMDKDKPRLHVGLLELHPYASIQEKYDTNIMLEPRGQGNMDWITDYRTGLAAQMPFIPSRGDDYFAEAYYHADFIHFARHDKLSRIDHTAHGSVRCKFPNDIGVRITEDFLKTQDPPNNERTLLTKRWQNKLDARVDYTREKVKLESAYTVTMNRYIEFSNLDYDDHMITGTTFYKIATKTWLLGEFNYGRIRYHKSPTNSDSSYYQGRIGVEGKIAPKLTGTLKLGGRYQGYSRPEAKDYAGFTAFLNIKYEITKRTNLNFYGETRPEEASYATNSFYTANILGLKFDHLLMRRLRMNGGTFWAYNRYPSETREGDKTAKRQDTLWGISVGFKYEIVKETLFFEPEYVVKQRHSNFHNFSYKDQQVILRGSLLF